MRTTNHLRAERDDLLDALRDVICTCAPFSGRGAAAINKAKLLISKIEASSARERETRS